MAGGLLGSGFAHTAVCDAPACLARVYCPDERCDEDTPHYCTRHQDEGGEG